MVCSFNADGIIQPALAPINNSSDEAGASCARLVEICSQVGRHRACERHARQCHSKPPEGFMSG